MTTFFPSRAYCCWYCRLSERRLAYLSRARTSSIMMGIHCPIPKCRRYHSRTDGCTTIISSNRRGAQERMIRCRRVKSFPRSIMSMLSSHSETILNRFRWKKRIRSSWKSGSWNSGTITTSGFSFLTIFPSPEHHFRLSFPRRIPFKYTGLKAQSDSSHAGSNCWSEGRRW